jgi:hypothetical protein
MQKSKQLATPSSYNLLTIVAMPHGFPHPISFSMPTSSTPYFIHFTIPSTHTPITLSFGVPTPCIPPWMSNRPNQLMSLELKPFLILHPYQSQAPHPPCVLL